MNLNHKLQLAFESSSYYHTNLQFDTSRLKLNLFPLVWSSKVILELWSNITILQLMKPIYSSEQ